MATTTYIIGGVNRSAAMMLRAISTRRTNQTRNDVIEVPGPAFAESISEGDIRWVKQKGDSVKEDELVAEIETDKTTVEVASPKAGVIEELLVADGSKVTAKQKLFKLRIGGSSSTSEAPKTEPIAKPPAESSSKKSTDAPPSPPKAESSKQPQPSPPSQQSSKKSESSASGPIPSSAPPSSPPPTAPLSSKPVSQISVTSAASKGAAVEHAVTGSRSETRVKMNRMRLRIASRLKDAQNTYAMLTTFNEIDMSNVIEMRARYQTEFMKKHNIKLGFMSPFIRAAAYALQDQPIVNAVIDEGEIVYRQFVDISIAVATPKGLVVPVIRNVESMNYAQIELSLSEIGERARDGKLEVADMQGGTFTISNGGVFGSKFGTPIINPPQSAILGMHAIDDRAVVVDGKIVIRPIMIVALTYDHQLIDGREAVTFLKKIKTAVEDPRSILLAL